MTGGVHCLCDSANRWAYFARERCLLGLSPCGWYQSSAIVAEPTECPGVHSSAVSTWVRTADVDSGGISVACSYSLTTLSLRSFQAAIVER